MFFFGVKKERKNLWGDASPKPRRPWRSGAKTFIVISCERRKTPHDFAHGGGRSGVNKNIFILNKNIEYQSIML